MPQHELGQLTMEPRHLSALQALLQTYVPEAQVWAYGSRVYGTGHETSDLDVVLRHPADLSVDVPGWADFKEAIQDSSLPILVDLHLWSRLPKSFHANIEAGYVVVQKGKPAVPQSESEQLILDDVRRGLHGKG